MRIFGLDVLRAFAIGAVVLSHVLYDYRDLWPAAVKTHLWLGFLGTEVFFVLSGFLVGRIALRELFPLATLPALLNFWRRRWWRTLPNYFLFLLLFLWLVPEGQSAPWWRHATFTQNLLSWEGGKLFGISWSLALEEWFYLLLPAALFGASRVLPGARGRAFAWAVAFIALPAVALRTAQLGAAHPDWDGGIRRIVLFRLDALMVGVVLAYLRTFHLGGWEWLCRRGAWLGAWGIAVTAALFFSFPVAKTRWLQWALFPLISGTLFCSLPPFTRWVHGRGAGAAGVTALSLWSYALYLCHLWVKTLFERVWAQPLALPLESRWVWSAAFVAVSVALSAAVYRYFEAPLTRLRDRPPRRLWA